MNKPIINAVSLNILGTEYKIACEKSEQDELIRSATELDKQMRKIRDTGKVIGTDKIAVLAALNMAYEPISAEADINPNDSAISERLLELRLKIEKVLENL